MEGNGSTTTGSGVAAAWPTPPRFYRLYAPDAPVPPPPPPRPPVVGQGATFSAFGVAYRADYALPTLQEQGLEQLYPQEPGTDMAEQLRRMTHSVVFSFLQLLELLVQRPSDTAAADTKLRDIELLFINIHHLINSYRPHQAREQLVAALKDHVARRREAVAALEALVADVRLSLRQGLKEVLATTAATTTTATDVQMS